MTLSFEINRRRAIQTAAAAAFGAVGMLNARRKPLRAAANDRLSVGVIGLGSRGFNLVDALLREPDAQIVALCDVDEFHHRDRPWGQGPAYGRQPGKQRVIDGYAKKKKGKGEAGVAVYSDFRELCAHDDLDAVVVATPDHWHALCTLEAIRSGHDVYCEKPVTHYFAEGQRVVEAVRRAKAVVQVGSQQRSEFVFRRAVELARNGYLGKIQRVEVGLPPGYESPMGDDKVIDPPKHLDYDLWCGPALKLPYMRARHHRWWRGHRAFGGGVLMDWIGHHNDIAHWATGMDHRGPLTVEAVGWTKPKTDVYDTPHQYGIRCEYPGAVEWLISSQLDLGTKLIGDAGWLFVTRGKLNASNTQWVKRDFDPAASAPRGEGFRVGPSPTHMRNFLDAIGSRAECVAPPRIAHRSITPGHLGYVSNVLKRKLRWDSDTETVVGDDEADRLLKSVEYHGKWKDA